MNKATENNKEFISTLIGKLGDENGSAREEARLALIAIGEPAVAPLAKALDNKTDQVRWEAAKALGRIASPTAAPALVKTLEDKNFDIRWLAAEGLISIGISSAHPLLEALTKSANDFFLREGAHHVLTHLSGSDMEVWHHKDEHPQDMDVELKEVFTTVKTAIEGSSPSTDVPFAAKAALDILNNRK